MTITTYSELKTALVNWSDRTDLISVIPDFVTLAESLFKREVRTSKEEKTVDLTTTVGSSSIELPTDFNGIRHVYINGDYKTPLSLVALEKLYGSYGGNTVGLPIMFSVVGDSLILGPTPDSEYIVNLDYYGFTALSDNNEQNTILTNNPDLYLMWSLVYLYQYLHDEEREMKYTKLATDILENIKKNEFLLRFGNSPIMARVI